MNHFYGRPSQEGYYWQRIDSDKWRIVYVYISGAEVTFTYSGNEREFSMPSRSKGYEWVGPIKEPQLNDGEPE